MPSAITATPYQMSTNTILNAKDLEQCQSLQREELEVLESIYPECISSYQPGNGSLKLEVPIELDSPCYIELESDTPPLDTQKLSLSILPPVLLQIILPASYPVHAAPTIVSITAVHDWAPDLITLKVTLDEMWASEEGILYRWIEYIRSGEFLQTLGIGLTAATPLKIIHRDPLALTSLLSTYEKAQASSQFTKLSYPCGVCLEDIKGSKCLQLECSHVFCRSCLEDFWGMCITEGNVDRISCPDPGCVKEKTELSEQDLLRVISSEQSERWKWLKTKQKLEKDPTIMHCPITTCQALIPKPEGVDPASGWDRYRHCNDCFFSFCSFCKYTWHGPISPCPLPFTLRVFDEYMAAAENSPERALIESRYGKATISRLIKEQEEQKATESWITVSTSVCPGCASHVEKSGGCNHMTCSRCSQHFCYRCQGKIKQTDPYEHFNIRGTYCYDKLFAADDDAFGDQADDPFP